MKQKTRRRKERILMNQSKHGLKKKYVSRDAKGDEINDRQTEGNAKNSLSKEP
jgi:hypothetical protein